MSDSSPIERAAQQSILQAMRDGASFANVHKEGGSLIRYDGGRFEFVEYGDSPSRRVFANDGEFLSFLRRFHDTEVARGPGGAPLSEGDAWRLILRRLQPSSDHAHAPNPRRFSAATLGAAALTLLLAAVLGYHKWHPRADALRVGLPGAATHPPPAPIATDADARGWQRMQEEHRRRVEAAQAAAQPTRP